MRKTITQIAGAFMLLTVGSSYAQMTGTFSVPGTFTSLAAAVNSLNTAGVGAGGATINIAAAYTETAPVGGYILTASGTGSTSPIVFQKSGSGANPVITAYAGTAVPTSASQDGVFLLIGSDYITFDGVDITDPNANNPGTMEFGYGLFAAGNTNGSQYNTIKNCVITLNRANNTAGAGPVAAGSRGINVVGVANTTQTTAISFSATTGSNSYNKFYHNVIQNCNIGIALYGGSAQAYYDTNNDIGGTSAATSNTIVNFGGGSVASAAYGVYTMYQQNLNLSNNIINNNNGSGINHQTLLYGVYLGAATGANCSVLTNTLTVSNGAAAGTSYAIYNGAGSAAASTSVNISNNLIANCNNTIVTSGYFYGIVNAGSASTVNISNNTFSNNAVAGAATGYFYGIYNTGSPVSLNMDSNTFTATTTGATSGPVYHIVQAGAPTGSISMQNNGISWTHVGATAHSGVLYGIYNSNSGATATLNVSGNDFSNITHSVSPTTENLYFINLAGGQSQRFVNGNTWTNLNLNHSYYEYLIYNAGTVTNSLTANSNSIVGAYSRGTGISHYMFGIYNYYVVTAASGSREIANNSFSNISSANAGPGYFYGIYDTFSGYSASAPYGRMLIHNNVIANVNIAASGNYPFYGIVANNYIGSDGTNGSAVYSNTVANINHQGNVTGYYIFPTLSDPAHANEIYANEVSNVMAGYGATGFNIAPGASSASAHLKVYKNKIANLTSNTANAAVYGIYAASGYYADIYNNIIGQLYSNYSSGSAPSVAGIYIGSGHTNLWYNTIYLDAGNAASSSTVTVTASSFASAAVYDNAGYNLDMRNNILINKSITKGTGKAIALWRSAFAPNTYSLTSNSNLFYAGVPSASNVIYYDGATSFQALNVYKLVITPSDSSSVSEPATPFLSTIATATDFLHIDASQYTLARNHAVSIPGIGDDYDADVRQGSTGYVGSASSPDIGADEFNLCIPPLPPVSLSVLSDYVICGSGGGTTSLSAMGTGTVTWYSTAVGGSSIASGNSFTTPFLTTDTVFYAANTTSCSSNRLAFHIVVLPRPVVSVMTSTNTICQGSSISLIAVGDAATYTWSQGGSNATAVVISPTTSTTYSVMASAAYGCTNIASQDITVNPLPGVIAISQKSVICRGEAVTLKASGAQTYTWTSNSLFATGDAINANPFINTSYTVTGTGANGCTGSAVIQQNVSTCTGINEAAGNLQMAVYPNPTSGEFTVELNNGLEKTVELFDVTGRLVMNSASADDTVTININQVSNGVYYLKVKSNNAVKVVKVVKQ